MKPGMRATGPRWFLLCLLLLGVVGMHHFAPAEAHDKPGVAVATAMTHMPPSAPMHEPDEPVPSPAHDLLHLCMAVLCVIVGLFLARFLFTKFWSARVPSLRRDRHIRRVDRPPGSSGRNLLSSVCVLRL
jgi:hypothetical protein